MIGLEKINRILDEITDRIPEEIYTELNGGVVLLPDCKIDGEFYIMGEYCFDSMMGRRILIYGGSFQQLYAQKTEIYIRKELERTLKHELTHHVESLAGERDLERQDALEREAYQRNWEK
jgi:hypothetical protein